MQLNHKHTLSSSLVQLMWLGDALEKSSTTHSTNVALHGAQGPRTWSFWSKEATRGYEAARTARSEKNTWNRRLYWLSSAKDVLRLVGCFKLLLNMAESMAVVRLIYPVLSTKAWACASLSPLASGSRNMYTSSFFHLWPYKGISVNSVSPLGPAFAFPVGQGVHSHGRTPKV